LQYWGWTQGLHLEPLLQVFCDKYFWGKVSWRICLGLLLTMTQLISASWVARITGISHLCQTFSSFIIVISMAEKLYIYSCIENTSTIVTFLTSFFYPPSFVYNFPLAWLIFHNIACNFIRSIVHICEKTCSLWPSEPG
jgi:hypothetical protein